MKNKEKKFDAVKMMREIRDKVNKEIENLTPEQVVEYFRIHSKVVLGPGISYLTFATVCLGGALHWAREPQCMTCQR